MRYFSIYLPAIAFLLYQLVKKEFELNFEYDDNINVDGNHANKTFEGYSRSSIYIPSSVKKNCHELLHGWLYMPDKIEAAPIVIMSSGLGGQKDMALDGYASEFAKSGFGVLVIDYRGFGGSRSMDCPIIRNHINPWNHIDDIKDAVRIVKNGHLKHIDINVSNMRVHSHYSVKEASH